MHYLKFLCEGIITRSQAGKGKTTIHRNTPESVAVINHGPEAPSFYTRHRETCLSARNHAYKGISRKVFIEAAVVFLFPLGKRDCGGGGEKATFAAATKIQIYHTKERTSFCGVSYLQMTLKVLSFLCLKFSKY